MTRRRELREEERALWDEVTRDVRRARASRRKPAATSDGKTPVVSARPVSVQTSATPRKSASFGIDGATAERLKRGKVEPEAVLDLHGLTQARAHAQLTAFVRRAHECALRCVLVITGKGSPTKAGVLRTMVPRWLEEERATVAGVQAAHVKHGGAGALYVYLRRVRARQ